MKSCSKYYKLVKGDQLCVDSCSIGEMLEVSECVTSCTWPNVKVDSTCTLKCTDPQLMYYEISTDTCVNSCNSSVYSESTRACVTADKC